MTRRAFTIAGLAATRLRADSADDAWDAIALAARALSDANSAATPNQGSPVLFLSSFDTAMPGFQELRTNVTALLQQAELQCSIDLVGNEGDDQAREVEMDWRLRIVPLDGLGSTQRDERVHCRVARRGKKWLIVAFAPLSFFAPPKRGSPRR